MACRSIENEIEKGKKLNQPKQPSRPSLPSTTSRPISPSPLRWPAHTAHRPSQHRPSFPCQADQRSRLSSPLDPACSNCWPSSPSWPRWPACACGLTRVAQQARRHHLLPTLADGWDTLVIPLLGPLLCIQKAEHRCHGGEGGEIRCRLGPYPPSVPSQPTARSSWKGATLAPAAR